MYTLIANDMGGEVALGTSGAVVKNVKKYYCGQHVGMGELPGSDGYCGPDDGPQCYSCVLFTDSVPENLAEIAALRAAKTQYTKSLGREDRQHRQLELELRKEVDVQTKMVRELETDKETGQKRILELEAGAMVGQRRIRELEAGAAGDEWTRECEKV
jgi:hypothetical protein